MGCSSILASLRPTGTPHASRRIRSVTGGKRPAYPAITGSLELSTDSPNSLSGPLIFLHLHNGSPCGPPIRWCFAHVNGCRNRREDSDCSGEHHGDGGHRTGFCCKYTDCVVVCPVECFHEGEQMLFINPDEYGACVPECPVEAIYHEDDFPRCGKNTSI